MEEIEAMKQITAETITQLANGPLHESVDDQKRRIIRRAIYETLVDSSRPLPYSQHNTVECWKDIPPEKLVSIKPLIVVSEEHGIYLTESQEAISPEAFISWLNSKLAEEQIPGEFSDRFSSYDEYLEWISK